MFYGVLHTLGEIIERNNLKKTVMYTTTSPKAQMILTSEKLISDSIVSFNMVITLSIVKKNKIYN